MGFRLSANVVALALWCLNLTNLSYGAPTQDPCSALGKYADQSKSQPLFLFMVSITLPLPVIPRVPDRFMLIENFSEVDKIPAQEAYACLLSPPFNQTRSAHVHEQIRKMAHLLSSQAFFNDPKGLPLIVDRVDLNGTFDAIKKKVDAKKYQNDYQFHRDLTELFGGYHDGHTKYYTICMLGLGAFRHDYPLVSIVSPGEDTVKIYLVTNPATGEVGEEIVEIAGEPALDHLLKLVKVMKGPTDAAWIDADTRWNGLFVGRYVQGIQTGNFATRDLYPGPDFKMKTAAGKTIDVKWYVDAPQTADDLRWWKQIFKSTDSYAAACMPPPTTSDSQQEQPTDEPKNDTDDDADFSDTDGTTTAGTSKKLDFDFLDFISKRSTLNVRQNPDVDRLKALNARGDGDTVKDYSDLKLPNNPPVTYPKVVNRLNSSEQTLHLLKTYPDVAVWGIHSFMPAISLQDKEYELFFYYWRDYMIKNLKFLKKKGVKRLILDMSNNGGGLVILGMETVRRFFPEAEPFYGVDYRRSPLVDLILHGTNVTAGLNQINGKPFASLDDFLNPPVAKRGDYFTKIGRFNQLGASRAAMPDVDFTFKGDPPFPVENVVIVSISC